MTLLMAALIGLIPILLNQTIPIVIGTQKLTKLMIIVGSLPMMLIRIKSLAMRVILILWMKRFL